MRGASRSAFLRTTLDGVWKASLRAQQAKAKASQKKRTITVKGRSSREHSEKNARCLSVSVLPPKKKCLSSSEEEVLLFEKKN